MAVRNRYARGVRRTVTILKVEPLRKEPQAATVRANERETLLQSDVTAEAQPIAVRRPRIAVDAIPEWKKTSAAAAEC